MDVKKKKKVAPLFMAVRIMFRNIKPSVNLMQSRPRVLFDHCSGFSLTPLSHKHMILGLSLSFDR